MTKWNPTLLENGSLQLDKTITVPEMLTTALWMEAVKTKIEGTNLTLADWIGTYTRKDLEDIGIPWPESPWDRGYEISQNLQKLLIRTLWNGIIISKIKADGIK
jgi:hypothetical protein